MTLGLYKYCNFCIFIKVLPPFLKSLFILQAICKYTNHSKFVPLLSNFHCVFNLFSESRYTVPNMHK